LYVPASSPVATTLGAAPELTVSVDVPSKSPPVAMFVDVIADQEETGEAEAADMTMAGVELV
jgi:hypothetical protein